MTVSETLSVDDVGVLLNKSPDWVLRHVRDFERLKVGRTVRFTPEQAEEFIRSFTVQPGSTDVPDRDADPLRSQTSKSKNRNRK